MRAKGFEGMTCSIASVLGALGDRWGALILRDLFFGLSRYDDLRRSSNITNATLSGRLKHLEQNGLIERTLYQTGPNRYEYRLTPQGKDLALVMQAMVQVGDKWNLGGLAAPPVRLVNRNSGKAAKVALVDEDTGAELALTDVRVVAGPGADDLVRWRLTKSNNELAPSLPQASDA
ncbi:DNA-binding HxlR family transcriptional regulator [Paraburkholderia atlantica]|uniref:winged helix-turn-helix transcriptional regulator n=1 Tax=Paraburkholderia atlantica TaxID=2654982 RepID=UPI003D226FB5